MIAKNSKSKLLAQESGLSDPRISIQNKPPKRISIYREFKMVSDASSEDIFDSEAVNLELHALDNQH